jgi:hypothetical protein
MIFEERAGIKSRVFVFETNAVVFPNLYCLSFIWFESIRVGYLATPLLMSTKVFLSSFLLIRPPHFLSHGTIFMEESELVRVGLNGTDCLGHGCQVRED